MSFMNDRKDALKNLSKDDEDLKTKVIGGRLYIETLDGTYHAVPRGMDDARALRENPAPVYYMDGENLCEVKEDTKEDPVQEDKKQDREIPEVGTSFAPGFDLDEFQC